MLPKSALCAAHSFPKPETLSHTAYTLTYLQPHRQCVHRHLPRMLAEMQMVSGKVWERQRPFARAQN